MLPSILACCIGTTVLLCIGATIVVSLIPVYLLNNAVPYKGQTSFSMDYSLGSNGNLSNGDLSVNQRNSISTQLSSILGQDVTLDVTSAVVKTQSSKRSLIIRATGLSQILEIRGTLSTKDGCAKTCLINANKQFQSNLCTLQLAVPQ